MIALHSTLCLSVLLEVSACASAPSNPAALDAYRQANDPAEPTNRAIFGANQFVDRNALKPVAAAYRDNVPGGVRNSVHNFVTNLEEPKVLINDVLQGNASRAWTTTQRFVVNSVAGGAGFFDVAGNIGLPHHESDFGQTFGVWGIGPGPAVQLPLFGPSDVRDTVGTVVGFVADPLNYIPGGTITVITAAGTASGVVDARSRLISTTNSLEKNSLDYYATLRSISAQRRAALVREGKEGRVQPTVTGGAESLEPGVGATGTPGAP